MVSCSVRKYQITTSLNWEAEHLTEPQKQYAATDAWACLNIYNRLQELKVTGDYGGTG